MDSFEIFTKLDDAERDALEGPLTYEECKNHWRHLKAENHQARTILPYNFISISLIL